MLDAFDFFVVIFMVDHLAAAFHVSKAQIVLTLTATLVMRPVGALLFGMLYCYAPAGNVEHWRQELNGTLPRAGEGAPPLPAGSRPQRA